MLFSSPAFFLFFAIYFLPNLIVPSRYRLALIILGSSIFYAYWNPWYLWLPYTLIGVTHIMSGWMESAENAPTRRFRMGLTVVGLLAPLFFFKYMNFVFSARLTSFPLPLGISFVTFTLIAYVVDVYRRKFALEKRIERLAASVLFFPHLIAGPIVRPSQLIPQIARPMPAISRKLLFGVALFTLGLVKKLVFADQIAPIVDKVFQYPEMFSGLETLFAVYGFSLQIYCDFSGYTDMALGLAHVLGIRLPNNFSQPYGSQNLVEFWHRWHMTLSAWLRDYLYIPLGGNRKGKRRQLLNLLITMVLGGLWHGANLTFVAWGALHGMGLCALHWMKAVRVPRWVATVLTFHFVTLAWVFFRAPDFKTAGSVLHRIVVGSWSNGLEFVSTHVFAVFLLMAFLLLHRWDAHSRVRLACRKIPKSLLFAIVAFLWMLAIVVSAGNSAEFIYFDF